MRLVTCTMLLCAATLGFAGEKQVLFNGENLDGWSIHENSIENPGSKKKRRKKKLNADGTPQKLFYVKDGVIETPGRPKGHLRTIQDYSDYKLHVEWRYPETPKNSGIYIHTTGPDEIPGQNWAAHYQVQLKHDSEGDFIVQGIGRKATIADVEYLSTESNDKPILPKFNPSNVKLGEWNSFDILCKGDLIEIRINGLLQNVATKCSVTRGGISLQAEGGKIQFRNIWIESLD